MSDQPRRRVLVVEDDINTARSIELYLTHEGYELTRVGDGLEGLAEARSGRHATGGARFTLRLPA